MVLCVIFSWDFIHLTIGCCCIICNCRLFDILQCRKTMQECLSSDVDSGLYDSFYNEDAYACAINYRCVQLFISGFMSVVFMNDEQDRKGLVFKIDVIYIVMAISTFICYFGRKMFLSYAKQFGLEVIWKTK
eukprot:175214_1